MINSVMKLLPTRTQAAGEMAGQLRSHTAFVGKPKLAPQLGGSQLYGIPVLGYLTLLDSMDCTHMHINTI